MTICLSLPSLGPGCDSPAGLLAACRAHAAGIDPRFAGAALLAALALTIFGAAIARQIVGHRQVVRGLRRDARAAVLADQRVLLVPGTGISLVAGIRDPRIYCSLDLPDRLDPAELRAVVLHERHHQLGYAPARLVFLAAIAPLLDVIRPGRAWLDRERARIEIEADAHALRNGVTRAALARAILKLQAPPDASLAGFASAGTLRLEALFLREEAIERRSPLRSTAVVAMVVVPAFASLVCSLLAAAR